MREYAEKEELLKTAVLPEKMFRLPSGKYIRLRTLRPSLRAALKELPQDRKIVKSLAAAMAEPELTEAEAYRFLDGDPFTALAVYAESVRMGFRHDERNRAAEQERDNEAFLKVTGAIARAIRRNNE